MFKLAKTRGFDYRYQFYNPEDDEDKKRIKFKRIRKSSPAKKGSVLKLFIFAVALLLGIIYLQKKSGGSLDQPDPNAGKIILEDFEIVE